jgi:hypothetical protein
MPPTQEGPPLKRRKIPTGWLRPIKHLPTIVGSEKIFDRKSFGFCPEGIFKEGKITTARHKK